MIESRRGKQHGLLKYLTPLFVPTAAELQSVPLFNDLSLSCRTEDTSFEDFPYVVSSSDPKLNGRVSWIRKIQCTSTGTLSQTESLTNSDIQLNTNGEESDNSSTESDPSIQIKIAMPRKPSKSISLLRHNSKVEAVNGTKNSKNKPKKRSYVELVEDETMDLDDGEREHDFDFDVVTTNVEILPRLRSRRDKVSEDSPPKRARTRKMKTGLSVTSKTSKKNTSLVNESNYISDKVGRNSRTNAKENSNPVRTITLNTWSLKSGSRNKILVAGYRDGDDSRTCVWCSSSITERISNTKVRSSTGTIYILSGQIQIDITAAQGINKKIAIKFRYGFPVNWESILYETGINTKYTKTKKAQPRKVDHENSFSFLSKSTRANLNELSASICKFEVDDLPRTRSGRRVIPRLAFWANQYVKTDTSQNISIVNGTASCVDLRKKKDKRLETKSSNEKQNKIAKQQRESRKKLKTHPSERKNESVLDRSRSHPMTLRCRRGGPDISEINSQTETISTSLVITKITRKRREIIQNSSSSKTRSISRSPFQSINRLTAVCTVRDGAHIETRSRSKTLSVRNGFQKAAPDSENVTDNTVEQNKSIGGSRKANKKKSSVAKLRSPFKGKIRKDEKNAKQEIIDNNNTQELTKLQTKNNENKKNIQSPVPDRERERTPELTARPGTLARKRQIQDIMRVQSQNYEADLFTATAYKLPEYNIPGLDDNDNFELKSNSSSSSTCKTPTLRIPSLQPASRHRTPEPDFAFSFEPEINRKEVDTYIHNRRKKGQGPQSQKRLRHQSNDNKTPKSSSKAPNNSFYRLNKKISSLLVSDDTAQDNFNDGEEEDYYFD